jgi:hypothetical protein
VALTNRGVKVTQQPGVAKRYTWLVGGVKWGWEQHPDRRLFRGTRDLSAFIDRFHFLCLDDAILFSLGYDWRAGQPEKGGLA